MPRGYIALGFDRAKNHCNIDGAMRAADCYGAILIVVGGIRFKPRGPQDTTKAWRRIPVLRTENVLDLTPYDCVPVAIELHDDAEPLPTYKHQERAFYIFGPEDGSISNKVLKECRDIVYIPTNNCMNLAATVNVVLYDRMVKQMERT